MHEVTGKNARGHDPVPPQVPGSSQGLMGYSGFQMPALAMSRA
jgi:hypothetical protein